MKIAVRFYGSNDKGIPEDYPEICFELKDGETCQQGFVEMSKEEYEKYKADRIDSYLAVISEQNND